ncbi:DUF523 domain-containing protein [Sporosarcina sp. Te-1]|uniref:DUF523 domain-containing protein n=1 Tax=Sporosarcina sp. Te-1 TaxID=2818390 RepID=UPI001A9DC940|nr:DUF523 domain-containing protein [Sporosarcina sp. Te-1]QTD41846.1 DUF523 domain-containing protein [Sporosarcina sp. Te-1]
MILVSSCLAGLPVRYNGTGCQDLRIEKLLAEKKAIAVCPELLGGFPTLRDPAEIVGGDGDDVLNGKAEVVEKSGRNATDLYLKGARLTLEKALEFGATTIVLKESSPSCGSSLIYNGEFNAKKISGVGVTTALLRRHGLQVISEENLPSFLDSL